MTFETGKKYRDVIGRKWWVLCSRNVDGNTVLALGRYFVGGPNKYAIGVVEDDGKTATVLIEGGFTTIFDEEEKE